MPGRINDLDAGLCEVGAEFHRRGWVLATAGNFSAVVSRQPYRLRITASGRHKGRLGPGDFLTLDEEGQATESGSDRPSAETALHLMLTQHPEVGAVLHTHSVWATVLSQRHFAEGGVALNGYEMLKAFDGIRSHAQGVWVPIFDNTQDIPALATQVAHSFASSRPPTHGFLIRQHGLYTWGRDLAEAARHIEAFEFLFEVIGQR